jgi:uncharacterized protein YciI
MEEVQRLQQAHLDNIGRLADLGLMALAGPFWTTDNSNRIRGLFFYRVNDRLQADTLVSTDPAVAAGRLAVDNYAWLGSAGLAYDTIDGMEGMRNYFAALYRIHDSTAAAPSFDDVYTQQQAALAEACDNGRIVMAGPFTECRAAGDPFALFIYSADTLATVEQIAAAAPGIADSALTVWTINWFGPKGLRE